MANSLMQRARPRRLAGVLLSSLLITVALVVSGGAGGVAAAAGRPATGTPLVFGLLGTNSGPLGDPEVSQGLQAYISNWNAHGGYKGHPIRLIVIDAGTDPTATANGAHQLVQSDHVIAMVDNYAMQDCAVNNTYYSANHIAVLDSLQATCYIPGTDFPSGKIGGSNGASVAVKFLANIGHKNIAFVSADFTGVDSLVAGLRAEAKSIKGTKFTQYTIPAVPTAADLDAVLAQMKAAGVDGVINLSATSTTALILQEAKAQNFGDDKIGFVFGPNDIAPDFAKTFEGAYFFSFSLPLTSNEPAFKTALAIMRRGHVSSLDGAAVGGYQAGGEFQEVLNLVKGPVTRASFLKAAERATSISVPLTPALKLNLVHPMEDPFGGVMLKAANGTFVQASGFLVTKY